METIAYRDDDWNMTNSGFMTCYLAFNEYNEMTFQELCTRPMWRFRKVYEYQHELRKNYGLDLSRLHLS